MSSMLLEYVFAGFQIHARFRLVGYTGREPDGLADDQPEAEYDGC